jgi:hypothetical protein
MTMPQAAALQIQWKQRIEQIKWNQQTDPLPCEHLHLELEWDILGHSDGNYVCIHCGETVAQRSLVA